jgi:transcriptional regulator GlxA family with amidase domain
MAIMEIEYASDLRVEDVAYRVATSRRQLQRSFDEIGHTSFGHQLATLRVQHAAQLLATAAISVSEVARRVGYRHAPHFAKVFRLHHGVSPSAFRTQMRAASGGRRELRPGR